MKCVFTALLCVALGVDACMGLRAAETANAYVTVRSSTYGVESIIPRGSDFCVTTRGVGRPFFRADIRFRASRPYYLVEPSSGRMSLGVGENGGYRVRDESGNEDTFSGTVWVLKLDVEPTEVNVSCRSSSCTLKLTDDSFPGGRAVWTSCPEGIGGRGNSITFNPSALEPGEYRVTARSGFVPSYADSCVVRIVKVTALEHQIGDSTSWKSFSKPQKILYGKESRIHANVMPDRTSCESVVKWAGSYGVQGEGFLKTHTYEGLPSGTDADLKSVATDCGPDPNENFLVCPFVVGIHSNAGPTNSFMDGHAWLTVTSFETIPPTTTSFGLWGNRPRTKAGSDVHIGLESETGEYNRYFLMSLSQEVAIRQFTRASREWKYSYTCANWAEEGFSIASQETISSRDYILFGTPRAIGESIQAAEMISPTRRDVPRDGGEDAPSTSSGVSTSESSFPFP